MPLWRWTTTIVIAWALTLAAPEPTFAKSATKIVPGPLVISEEEKGIAADPERGAEHGVVLLEEVERNQDLPAQDQFALHMRAKIFTNEGRDLANVSVPIGDERNELVEWWGRTLLPDGKVLELKREELIEQSIIQTATRRSRELKGALPGVVPGAILDFGFVIRHQQNLRELRIPLQSSWLIRELHYDWVPSQGKGAAHLITLADKLDFKVTKEERTRHFIGRNLPPVPSEPMMPPDDESRAMLTIYYTLYPRETKYFWPDASKNVEERLHRFLTLDQFAGAKTQVLKDAIKQMALPPDADLSTKLRTAYDWVKRNVHRNLKATGSEERQSSLGDDTAALVLEAKKGTPLQMNRLFAGLARELGAKAYIVYAPDRTDHYFNPELISYDQFDGTLVAVFSGADPKEYTLADPGSGLPYGEISWWYSGAKGLLLIEDTAKMIVLWPSEARSNVSDTKVTLELVDDNTLIKTVWKRKAGGQQWLLDLWRLRGMEPEPRKKRLAEICGKAGDVEVARAEAPDLEQYEAPFRVECESSRPSVLDEETTTYKASITGAWIEAVPELTARTRTHPVIFNFPHVDLTTIDLRSPKGFVPEAPPGPVKLEGKFGRYEMTVEKTDQGFLVQRKLAFLALRVPAGEYGELRKFIADVALADRTSLSFHRSAPAAAETSRGSSGTASPTAIADAGESGARR